MISTSDSRDIQHEVNVAAHAGRKLFPAMIRSDNGTYGPATVRSLAELLQHFDAACRNSSIGKAAIFFHS